jgi:hypothetical protein
VSASQLLFHLKTFLGALCSSLAFVFVDMLRALIVVIVVIFRHCEAWCINAMAVKSKM